MSIKNDLIAEFDAELEEVAAMEVGSTEHDKGMNGVTKLADRIIEIEKIESEAKLKEQQMKNEQRDRLIKNCIEVGTALTGIAVYAWAFVASTNFEKEGTLTTEGGRNSLRNLLKLKF